MVMMVLEMVEHMEADILPIRRHMEEIMVVMADTLV
jgi:hypothetical protein